jgi:glycerophosphoryl diester phosphodiesterase
MILISHRGNIDSVNNNRENTQSYIQEAIDLGYDVEIDVWCTSYDQLYLGHDKLDNYVKLDWLLNRKDNLWVHCKNFKALTKLIESDLRVFYHTNEDYTIISDKHIWAHNLENIDENCIIPLIDEIDIKGWIPKLVFGVCSDYIGYLKND